MVGDIEGEDGSDGRVGGVAALVQNADARCDGTGASCGDDAGFAFGLPADFVKICHC